MTVPSPAKLCVTVTAATTAELVRRRDAVPEADLIELRLDGVGDLDVDAVLAGRTRPVLVTCRPTWEGGAYDGDERQREAVLTRALAAGADYVDVEWRAGFDALLARGGRRIVLSSHDFSGVPGDLLAQARAMAATGAGVVKIAITTRRLSDCLPLLSVRRELPPDVQTVLIGMGDTGIATRVLAARFGSVWTYAGALRGVGQVSAERLTSVFRYRAVTAATAVYGLLGNPVHHSVSPEMHNAAFGATGVDAVYLPLPAVDVADFQSFAEAIGLQGASVTIPFKRDCLAFVEAPEPSVARIGAINTLKRSPSGGWLGRNTDGEGFLAPLRRRGMTLEGCRAALLGAGGSARAVAVALRDEGALVTVHARDRAKAEAVAVETGSATGPWPPADGAWDLLVNCTPVGMFPAVDAVPVPLAIPATGVVYDLIYNPPVTRLLEQAAHAGAQAVGGLEMLVAQASAQFGWWTGHVAPDAMMAEAARARLSEFNANDTHLL